MNLIIIKGFKDLFINNHSLVESTRYMLTKQGYNCSRVWQPTGDNQHIFMVTLRPYQTFDLDALSDDLTAYRIEDDGDLVALVDYKFREGVR